MAKKRAARNSNGPNQSAFIREVFKANPAAKVSDANTAWTEAGHKGGLNNSLFYQVKRKLGMSKARTSKRRGRPPGNTNEPKAPPSPGKANYEAVEERLDEVIHLLWELGDHNLVTEFRLARRKIAAKLA